MEFSDVLFPEAVKVTIQYDRASAALIQRRLRIGYARAARLLEELEKAGIVSKVEEGRSRKVLRKDFSKEDVVTYQRNAEFSNKRRVSFHYDLWSSPTFEAFVGKEISELYNDSNFLMNKLDELDDISDYSFALVPLAKAYEGILKKILVSLDLVSESQLKDDPNLAVAKFFDLIGGSKISEKLRDKKRDKTVPLVIFTTYQDCRNKILHYDPYSVNKLAKDDAEIFRGRILDAIKKAYDTFITK